LPAIMNMLKADANSGFTVSYRWTYFFMLYNLPMTNGKLFLLAFVACICTAIAQPLRRKLRFAVHGKKSANLPSIAGLIYTIVALIIPVSPHMLWIFWLYVLLCLISIITMYPRRRRRPVKEG